MRIRADNRRETYNSNVTRGNLNQDVSQRGAPPFLFDADLSHLADVSRAEKVDIVERLTSCQEKTGSGRHFPPA
jgi:hypothetical protein